MTSNELETCLEKGNYCRAAYLALSQGLDETIAASYLKEALWQMAAVYRNAPGTKKMAQDFGITREELEEILLEKLKEAQKQGQTRELEPCYDQETRDYLTFEQWLKKLFREWKNSQT